MAQSYHQTFTSETHIDIRSWVEYTLHQKNILRRGDTLLWKS